MRLLSKLKTPLSVVYNIQLIGWLIIINLASCKCVHLKFQPDLNFSVDKDQLLGGDTSIELKFFHGESAPLKLENYKLIVKIQEIGETGSTLRYTDSDGHQQNKTTIDEPLTHFFQEKTLTRGKKSAVYLPLNIEPGIDVSDLIITFELYDITYASTVETKLVRWIDLVTDFTIKQVEIANLSNFAGNQTTEFQLKNNEANVIQPRDITITLESSNAAKFEFINYKGELAGTETTLKDLFGHNKAIQPNDFTAPIQFKLTDDRGETSAQITITVKQGDTVICTQKVMWTKKAIQLELKVDQYVLGSKEIKCSIINHSTEPVLLTDQVVLGYKNSNWPSNKAELITQAGLRFSEGNTQLNYIHPKDTLSVTFTLDFKHEESTNFIFQLLYDQIPLKEANVTCQEDVKLSLNISYDPNDPQKLVNYTILNQGKDEAAEVKLKYKATSGGGTIATKRQGEISHSNIPATINTTVGEVTDSIGKLDLKGQKQVSFDFILEYRGKPIGSKLNLDFGVKNIELEFQDLAYDPNTNRITYTIINKGTDSVVTTDEVKLEYQNTTYNTAELKHHGNATHKILLTNIAANGGTISDFLEVDLKNETKATFEFQLFCDKDGVGISRPVTCEVDLQIIDVRFNPNTNQVTFKVQNKGNTATTQPIQLTYENIVGNKAKLIGNGTIISSLKPGEASSLQTLNLEFNGEKAATFKFKLGYANNTIEEQHKFEKNINLKLALEPYIPGSNQVKYKVTNIGADQVIDADKITLQYKNTSGNTVILKLLSGIAIQPGTVELKNISANNGQAAGNLEVEFKDNTEAEFEFALYANGNSLGITDKITCKEDINLQLVNVFYDNLDKKIHYEINNAGKVKTVKQVFLKYTSKKGATLDGKTTQHIDLGQLNVGNKQDELDLPLDLKNNLEDTFDFQLVYKDKTLPNSKPVTFKIDLVITDLTFDKKDKKVNFKITNIGNANTVRSIKLTYPNTDNSNKAKLTKKGKVEHPISTPITAGQESPEQSLNLNFNGEARAEFDFGIVYNNIPVKNEPHIFTQDINLEITSLNYNPVTNQITYTVTNKGSDQADRVRLEYKNATEALKLGEKATLRLPTAPKDQATKQGIIFTEAMAGNTEKQGHLIVCLNGATTAQFKFSLYCGGKPIGTKTVECKALPKIKLTLTKADIYGFERDSELSLINESGFDLEEEDLRNIKITYIVDKKRSGTLLNKAGEDINNKTLSELLSQNTLKVSANLKLTINLIDIPRHGCSFTIILQGVKEPITHQTRLSWRKRWKN